MNATMAVARPAYEPPALRWTGETAQAVGWLWWAVIVGFSFTVATAYAAYCVYAGGEPRISLTWKGFKVECHR